VDSLERATAAQDCNFLLQMCDATDLRLFAFVCHVTRVCAIHVIRERQCNVEVCLVRFFDIVMENVVTP